MLIDEMKLKIKAGNGGDGIIAFDNRQKAFGGDGGDGGNVVLMGDINTYDLSGFDAKQIYKADDGGRGDKYCKHGQDGKDLVLKLPLITKVFDENNELIVDITEHGQEFKLLQGGTGGLGNFTLRGHTREGKFSRQKPTEGENLVVKFELNLKADAILLGYPNAGKSSILNALTRANSKVASYEFTTLEPQLGVMDGYIKLMDLPGLIEGTYEGKGVGTKFLKHTLHSRLLIHCISIENDELKQKYESLREEFSKISPTLSDMQELIVLTKSDTFSPEKSEDIRESFSKSIGKDVVLVSTYLEDSLSELKTAIKSKLDSLLQ